MIPGGLVSDWRDPRGEGARDVKVSGCPGLDPLRPELLQPTFDLDVSFGRE
jgi:hypothetical protein